MTIYFKFINQITIEYSLGDPEFSQEDANVFCNQLNNWPVASSFSTYTFVIQRRISGWRNLTGSKIIEC